jgi:hypothetical protein
MRIRKGLGDPSRLKRAWGFNNTFLPSGIDTNRDPPESDRAWGPYGIEMGLGVDLQIDSGYIEGVLIKA